jgi:hypothetical protein
MKGKEENEKIIAKLPDHQSIYLRVIVQRGGQCKFSYSLDDKTFMNSGELTAEVGRWIGAKVGLFCSRQKQINDSGYADFDWFRVEKP